MRASLVVFVECDAAKRLTLRLFTREPHRFTQLEAHREWRERHAVEHDELGDLMDLAQLRLEQLIIAIAGDERVIPF